MSDQPPSKNQGADETPEESMQEGPPEPPVGGTIVPPSSDFMQQPTGGANVTEPAAPSPVEPDTSAAMGMDEPASEPPMSGYTPPSEPAPPQASYMPPQSQGSMSSEPPQEMPAQAPPVYGAQGGYTPPPPSGYSPPPPGGYTPPPPGGGYGYGAPPPPPPTGGMGMGGMSGAGMGGINQASIQSYLQRAFQVVMQPRVDPYQTEARNANWNGVLIGVGSVMIVAFIAAVIRGILGGRNAAAGGLVYGIFLLILIPALFFAGAGTLWLSAKIFGGRGQDFMQHSYLLSLSYTPTRLVLYALSTIAVGPVGAVVGLVDFVLGLYQVYHAGLSMQVSQGMPSNRAQLAAWVPTLIVLALSCVCALLSFAALVSLINGGSQ